MSQHDYVIDNASGATVRADINSALSAIQSLNSGTSAPSSTAAGMLWLDTTGGAPYALKVRDAGNNHWLTLGNVTDPGADGNLELLPGKINLPSSGGVFESDGSTEILTESSGSVTLKNTAINSSVTFPNKNFFIAAYVVFDGTSDTGSGAAQTILDSLNVTSVTRKNTDTGEFRVNLSITMANTNYVIIGSANGAGSNSAITQYDSGNLAISTTQFGIRVVDIDGVLKNVAYTNVIVIGDR